MKKITLGKVGKMFINRKNSQVKIDLRKRELKKFGLKPEDLMKLDITNEIKKMKKVNNFEEEFELKWR